MKNIFYGAFTSINNNVHEIFIYDSESTDPDNPVDIILETPGYLLSYDSGISDIVEYGICSSTVKIDIRNIGNVLDSFLNSLYISENRYIVEIKINSNRYWLGVLLSDFSTVEDATYSRVTLEAVDGLKLLTDEVEIIDENVKHSFLDYIIKALSLMPTAEMFLDTDSFAVVRTNWFSYLMDSGAEDDPLNLISCADTANSFLWETKSSRAGWNGETVVSIKAITYFEMLQKILKHFMVVLSMNNGKWYLAQRDLYESTNTLNFYQYTKTAALIMGGLHPDYLTESTYITNGALLKNYRSDGSFSFLPALKQAEITFISSSNGNPSMVSKEEIELMLSAVHTYVSPTLYSGTGNFISMCFDFFDRWAPSGAHVNDIWNAFVTFNVQVKLVGSTTTYYLTRAGSYGIAEYVWTTTPGVIPFAPIQLMGIIVTDWNITGPVYYRSVQQDYFIQMTSVDLPVDGRIEISFSRMAPVGTSMAPLNPNNAPIPPTWALDYSGINIVGTYNNPTTNYIYFIEANEDPTTSVYFRAENDIEGFTLINTMEDGIFGTSGIAARSLMEIWNGSSWVKPTIAQMKYWRKGSTGTFDVFFNQLLVDETLSNQENPLLVFNGSFHFRNANILTLFRVIEINYKTNNYRLWANKITYEPNAEKWSGDWFTIRRQKRAWHFTITPGTAVTAIPLVPIAASTNYILHRLDLLQVTADAISVDNHVINSDAFGLQSINKPRPIPASGVIQFAIGSRIINMDSFGNRSAVDDNDLVVYGYLYNWNLVLSNELPSSAAWRVPDSNDYTEFYNYIVALYPGGNEGLHIRSIRQDGTSVAGGNTTVEPYFENSVLEGLDTLNLGLVPGGCCRGGFEDLHQVGYYWTSDLTSGPYSLRVYHDLGELVITWDAGDEWYMFSVRLMRDASSIEAGLDDGTFVDDYIGNDGKRYAAVKIGNQVWMSENLAETKNNNGILIPYGTGLSNGRTAYNANNSLAVHPAAIRAIVSDTDVFTGAGTADSPFALDNAGDDIVYGIKNGKYEPIPDSEPGGNDTEVQFNDAAAFAGDSTFTFNKTTKVVDISKLKLAAGTTTLPPIQMASGDLITVSKAGTIEFNTDDYYVGLTNDVSGGLYSDLYPPTHTGTYVKATDQYYSGTGQAYFATDPAKLLTGTAANNSWWTGGTGANVTRFHIDAGIQVIVNRLYYENYHSSGGSVTFGAKDFTLWGTNSATAFATLTANDDTDWTEITGVAQSIFDIHSAVDEADPKYINVTNNIAYRYYAIKISSNHAGVPLTVLGVGLRRIVLQNGNPSYRVPIVLADLNKLTEAAIPLASTNGRLTDSKITYDSLNDKYVVDSDLEITGTIQNILSIANNINLTNTTFANQYGVIQKGAKRFIHDFNYGNNGTVTTEGQNIFIGEEAGNLTMGATATSANHSSYNVGIGYRSLYANTLGNFNTAVGYQSMANNTTGSENTSIGYQSQYANISGYGNTSMGFGTLLSNSTGSYGVAIGYQSQYYANNTTTPWTNSNVSIGYQALRGSTTAANNTGVGNVAIGYQAMLNNTSGVNNVAIGYGSGHFIANGSTNNSTGSNSVFLGNYTKAKANGETNQIVIGYNATGNGSNTVTIGNTSITDTYLAGCVHAPTAKFGSATDYTEFEADGTRHAVGAATTYRDELNNLVGQKLESPSSDIVTNYTECTLDFKTSAKYNVDFAFMNIQINHDWLIGTPIFPHLHWIQEEENTPNWIISYRWQINGGEKQTTWTPLIWNNSKFSWGGGSLNQITSFSNIEPPPGAGLSDILQIKLHRDTDNDSLAFGDIDNYTLAAQAYSFDIHIECDTDGSRSEYTK